MMLVGMIDADLLCRKRDGRGKTRLFPNLSLMKLSAFHKMQGDSTALILEMGKRFDGLVYISKVFSDAYSPFHDPGNNYAPSIIRGGSGYALSSHNGVEIYDKRLDMPLCSVIDHLMPDYSLYGIYDTAYGFLTKGCPRQCAFCHVAAMQGACSYSFASLDEFWCGQKHIKLLDPNITACPQWETHFDALIDSRAYVDFTQGLDVRLLDDQKLDKLRQIRTKRIHFAWDNPQDDLICRFRHVQTAIGGKRYNRSVYILTNFDSTHEQDVYRVETIKAMGWQPYVMIYDKPHAPALTRKLQRYANSPMICWSNGSFAEYLKNYPALIGLVNQR